jgi:hypothetical protein
VVECSERAPLKIVAGEFWQRRAAPDFAYPLDGTLPLEAANVPSTLAGAASGPASGYPGQATYRLDLPRATTVRVHVNAMAAAGGGLRVSVDGRIAATHRWAGGPAAPDPADLEFPMEAGPHVLLLENPGQDWIGVSEIDLGLDVPALALIGRRNEHVISAWIWNRVHLYDPQPPPEIRGTVDFADVAAGSWKVTWWDTAKGVASESTALRHGGGTLRLPTPPIGRDLAVVLTQVP